VFGLRNRFRKARMSLKGYAVFAVVLGLGMWLGSWIGGAATSGMSKTVAWLVTYLFTAGIVYYVWEKWGQKAQ